MHKRQLRKNRWIICLICLCISLNFFCFGIHQKSQEMIWGEGFYAFAGAFLGMAVVKFFDHREEMNSRGYIYGMLISLGVLTTILLSITFVWWILALFVMESGGLIALIIRFRPVA